jgi:hypothetical protein
MLDQTDAHRVRELERRVLWIMLAAEEEDGTGGRPHYIIMSFVSIRLLLHLPAQLSQRDVKTTYRSLGGTQNIHYAGYLKLLFQ